MAGTAYPAAVLTIDLGAICANYRRLRTQLSGADCGAAVKADAYGLGAERVAPALAAAGCRYFFVAHLDEGIALRPLLPAAADIFVLHGPIPGSEPEFFDHRLIPVLNSGEQIAGWRALAYRLDRQLPAIVQVDTGMSRMGLSANEVEAMANADALRGIALRYLMSHLACAEDQTQAMNAAQRERFDRLRTRFPACAASLANSSGIFLGPDFHYDLVRPGAALYGVAPVAGAPNPMQPVVRLQAGVIQTHFIEPGTPVGYGASYRASTQRRIATVAAGYADGWMRSLSRHGYAWVDGARAPIVGTVSMDTCALDVTDIAPERVRPGAMVDLICPEQPVDAVAREAGTIGYEILTSLGHRYRREYLDVALQADGSAAQTSI